MGESRSLTCWSEGPGRPSSSWINQASLSCRKDSNVGPSHNPSL